MTTIPKASPSPADDVLHNRAIQRRNFLALMGDYMFFGIALGILNPRSLPADFVAQLGGGPLLIGIAGLIYRTAWLLPQMPIANIINRAPRKKWYALVPGIPGRLAFAVAAGLMVLIGPEQPAALIAVMLTAYAIMALLDGVSMVAWTDILGSSITDRRRGWFFSISQIGESIAVVLGVTALVRFVLGPEGPAFPDNYALLLLFASGFLMLGAASFTAVKEGPSPPPEDTPGMRAYWGFLGRILRQDAGFRQYLTMRVLYDLAAIGMPFYIVFATERLGQTSAAALSDQVLLMTAASIFASLLMGRINDVQGPSAVIRLGAAAAVLGPLLVWASEGIGVIGLHLAWLTVGVVNAAFVPGFLNWMVQYAPDGYRPIYTGVASTVTAVGPLSPLLGGVIVAAASYGALFAVGAGLGAAALVLALRLPGPTKRTSIG